MMKDSFLSHLAHLHLSWVAHAILTSCLLLHRVVSRGSVSQKLCGCVLYRKMHVKQKDEKSIAKFRAKLADHARKLGGVFVHYDADAGTWIMKVDHF